MTDLTIRRFDMMRTIFAEYNPRRNSIDVYTSVGYMLRIDCLEAEKDLKPTPGSYCALNALAIDKPLEYAILYLAYQLLFYIFYNNAYIHLLHLLKNSKAFVYSAYQIHIDCSIERCLISIQFN